MNLVDLVDDDGLQQDDFTEEGRQFGVQGQLNVVGWSRRSWGNKLYILKCSECAKDSELFGEGFFKSLKSNLMLHKIPCGCSTNVQWTKEQFYTLCSRKAEASGYTFLGFKGEWKGSFTNLLLLCQTHGEWDSGTINNVINNGNCCPQCAYDNVAKIKTLPDHIMIASFFASGSFHPDTKFWRSDRKTSEGWKTYWYVSCPECGQDGESYFGNLKRGHRPCACSPMRQRECYINLIIDETCNLVVAIKFGIAINSSLRIKNQNLQSVYKVQQHTIYTFPSVAACKKAERECKKELETRVVLKRDMPDGYSETTYPYNLEKIIEIYERNGGIKLD